MNDQFNLPVQSLKVMCAVLVTTKIVTNCETMHGSCNAIESLPLPKKCKKGLAGMLAPIVKQMEFWLERLQFGRYSPSWTSYGVLDIMKSIEGFLEDETMDLGVRNVVARMYCHENYVFKLARKFDNSNVHISEVFPRSIVGLNFAVRDLYGLWLLWDRIIDAHKCKGGPDEATLQKLYENGINHAVYMVNDVAFKYFVSKASCRTVMRAYLQEPAKWINNMPLFNHTPVTIHLLFSKFNKATQVELKGFFSAMQLMSLQNWPYQHFFEESIPSLIRNLSAEQYFQVLERSVYDAENKLNVVYLTFAGILWKAGFAHIYSGQCTELLYIITERIRQLYYRRSVPGWKKSVDILLKCTKGCCCPIPKSRHLFFTIEGFRRRAEDYSRNVHFDSKHYSKCVFHLITKCISDEFCNYLFAINNELR